MHSDQKSELEVNIESDQAPYRPHIRQEDPTQYFIYLFFFVFHRFIVFRLLTLLFFFFWVCDCQIRFVLMIKLNLHY